MAATLRNKNYQGQVRANSDYRSQDVRASALIAGLTDEELLAEGCVSVPEACAFLGVKKDVVYRLMRGRLPFTRVGADRKIPRVALRAFAAEGVVRRDRAS